MSADFKNYIAIHCSPCSRSMWQVLMSGKHKDDEDKWFENMWGYLRQYKSAKDVPCCDDNHER